MKLATIRLSDGTGTRAVRRDGDRLVEIDAPDVGTLLADPDWHDRAAGATGPAHELTGADFAPVVPNPSKVICVGHNYSGHIKEMGRELPAYPTLFTKFADSLIGANDDIVKPAETDALDWEVELVVVVGSEVRRANDAQAKAAIAGFTVMNDVSVRDWQFRTIEWTQGKIWDSSTPIGPYLVTADEVAARADHGGRTGDAVRRHRHAAFRPGGPRQVRVDDHHAAPGGPDRHRYSGRGRPRP
jgi:acylpyruvate hydrolase